MEHSIIDIKENLKEISANPSLYNSSNKLTKIEPEYDTIQSTLYESLTPYLRAKEAATFGLWNDDFLGDLICYPDFKNAINEILTTKANHLDALELVERLKRISDRAMNEFAGKNQEHFTSMNREG